jgi:hypothetical protein
MDQRRFCLRSSERDVELGTGAEKQTNQHNRRRNTNTKYAMNCELCIRLLCVLDVPLSRPGYSLNLSHPTYSLSCTHQLLLFTQWWVRLTDANWSGCVVCKHCFVTLKTISKVQKRSSIHKFVEFGHLCCVLPNVFTMAASNQRLLPDREAAAENGRNDKCYRNSSFQTLIERTNVHQRVLAAK